MCLVESNGVEQFRIDSSNPRRYTMKSGRPQKFLNLANDPKFIAVAGALCAMFPDAAPNPAAVANALIQAGSGASIASSSALATDTRLVVRDREAAKLIGVHYNTIRAFADIGRLQRVKIGAKAVGVTRSSIDKLIAESITKPDASKC